MEVKCDNCYKSFKACPSRKKNKTTCSPKCSSELKSKLYKGLSNPKSLGLDKYDRFFWDRFQTITLRASKKDMPVTIDYLHLKKMFEKQNGLCFYSNIPMRIYGKRGYDTASVDRVDNNKGYVEGNIVWSLNSINSLKRDYPIDTLVKIASGLASTSTLMDSVKIKKIRDNAIVPRRSNPLDAGFDLYVSTVKDLGSIVEVGFGITLEPPSNLWFMCAERSSLYKRGLSLSNKLGILDQPYRGEIKGVFYKNKYFKELPEVGDRLVQIIPQRQYHIDFEEVEELTKTIRGEGGFGHTGK